MLLVWPAKMSIEAQNVAAINSRWQRLLRSCYPMRSLHDSD